MGKNYTDAVLRNDEVLLHDGNGREVGGGQGEQRKEVKKTGGKGNLKTVRRSRGWSVKASWR